MEKKMVYEPDYRWFVDPCGDPYTNEVIATQLSASGDLPMPQYLVDENGFVRGVYEIDRSFLRKLVQAKKRDENLKFLLFCRKGKGSLRKWLFEEKSKTKRTKKFQEVKKRIKEIKEKKTTNQ